jgi:rhodanese-related sulfurtransferase
MGGTVGYAGDLTPREAFDLVQDDPDAVLVDVRTEAEWRFVGVPSGLEREPVLVSWLPVDPGRFLGELAEAGIVPGTDRKVVFLCRSGQRSVAAAETATAAGMAASYNVLEGFEGPLDGEGHRGGSGWRAAGLPWRQS